MADFVRVIPAEGRLVRDLSGHRLADEGEVVDRSKTPTHWARLERNGDVTIEAIPEALEASTAAAAPAPTAEE